MTTDLDRAQALRRAAGLCSSCDTRYRDAEAMDDCGHGRTNT